MSGLAHFAVMQKGAASPPLEALKRAFGSFTNLTETDATRLSTGAHGFLLRHLRRDAAQAVQRALSDEGIATQLVAEDDIPKLPAPKALNRMELSPQALIAYDVLSRTRTVQWNEVRLLAAGAVRTSELAPSQLVMEILLTDGTTRYQVQAEGFPFKYVIDRPDLSIPQKFIWLVREISNYAPQAIVNEGARAFIDGREPACQYNTPQIMLDEMAWLLWRSAQKK